MEILDRIHDRYFVQFNEGRRIADYNTLYYDTPDLKMYIAHHDRKLNRQKLRARIYVDSGIAFCEVKNKNNKGRTKKKRIPATSMICLTVTKIEALFRNFCTTM